MCLCAHSERVCRDCLYEYKVVCFVLRLCADVCTCVCVCVCAHNWICPTGSLTMRWDVSILVKQRLTAWEGYETGTVMKAGLRQRSYGALGKGSFCADMNAVVAWWNAFWSLIMNKNITRSNLTHTQFHTHRHPHTHTLSHMHTRLQLGFRGLVLLKYGKKTLYNHIQNRHQVWCKSAITSHVEFYPLQKSGRVHPDVW